MKIFWQLAFRNLFRNGRRNSLTGISIVFGLVGMSLLGAYILRMERYLATQSVYLANNGHVIVYAKDGLNRHMAEPFKYSLSQQEVAELNNFAKQDARVVRASPLLKVSGLIHNGCQSFPFMASALDPETLTWARARPEVSSFVPELRDPAKGIGFWEAKPSDQPINISPRLAGILGKEKVMGETGAVSSPQILNCQEKGTREIVGNSPDVQLLGAAFESGMALGDASIVGQISSGMAFQDDTAVWMPYSLAQTMYQTDRATAFTFYLSSESEIKGFLRDLSSFAASKNISADIFPFYDESISPFYVGGMEFNWVMLCLFFAFVCTVAGISISNSLYISLMERKSELGTLRSLGFSQRKIRSMLLLESAFLFVFSILPGLLFTVLLRFAIQAANIRIQIPGLAGDVRFRLFLTPSYMLLLIAALGLLVGVVTFWGSTRFLRRPPLDLLGTSLC